MLFWIVTLAGKLTVYITVFCRHERPAATNPALQTNSHELLNQPWEVNVAFGMRVQLMHTPTVALAQPSRYAPVLHV